MVAASKMNKRLRAGCGSFGGRGVVSYFMMGLSRDRSMMDWSQWSVMGFTFKSDWFSGGCMGNGMVETMTGKASIMMGRWERFTIKKLIVGLVIVVTKVRAILIRIGCRGSIGGSWWRSMVVIGGKTF